MTMEERVERLERMVRLALEGIRLLHQDHDIIDDKLDSILETKH